MRKCLGKTDKLSYICLGKTDKIPPFNIRKEDKDMIKRKIDRYLADFFNADKKALMLTGARQIGRFFSNFGTFMYLSLRRPLSAKEKSMLFHP